MRLFTLAFLRPLRDLGFMAVRVGVGVVMALHGWAKWQAGPDGFLSGESLASLGIPQPEAMAWLVLIVELVGGILLVLGFLTRVFGFGTVILLAVKLVTVKGFAFLVSAPETGTPTVWAGEADWVLLFSALGLMLTGPGKLSLDYLFGIEKD